MDCLNLQYCKQICAELGQIVWKVEPLNPKGTYFCDDFNDP